MRRSEDWDDITAVIDLPLREPAPAIVHQPAPKRAQRRTLPYVHPPTRLVLRLP